MSTMEFTGPATFSLEDVVLTALKYGPKQQRDFGLVAWSRHQVLRVLKRLRDKGKVTYSHVDGKWRLV